jgi:hypothetical protein
MGLRLDQVLADAPRCRAKRVDYGNGLVFELKAFTAEAYKEVAESFSYKEKNTDRDRIALAIRAIEGQDCEPTDDQIKGFVRKLDKGVIERLALDWLAFNRGAEDLAQAAKKS